MMDVERRFTVPEVPDVWVFPAGARDVTGFYAYPAVPRIARDDRGAPEASLVVYGAKGGGGAFEPRGAVLTLTTTLDLTAEETARLRSALSRKVATEAEGGAPPAAVLRSPEVVAAEVEVRLADGVVLTGAAATTGGSRCSFNVKLDAAQTRSLRAALDRGLPDARISYRLRLRPGPSASTVELHQAAWSERSDTQRTEGSTSDLTVSRKAATAGSLVLEGPLGPTGGLGAGVTQVEL
jgi:hypothetical protein